MVRKYILLLIHVLIMSAISAQTAREVGVEIMAQLTQDSMMQISWLQQNGSTRYQVYVKGADDISWDRVADLSGSDTLYIDSTYQLGTRKEYRVARTTTSYTGFDGNGYIHAGFGVPARTFLGRVLMVIEDKYQTAIHESLLAYIDQIKNEGYEVDTLYVSPNAKDTTVKRWIFNEYSKDTSKNTMVFLVGRVPVPYSGNYRPDGHVDHTGAWPADLYYGAFDINWTDVSVNNTQATYSRNHNIPGDGKYDISRYNVNGQTTPIQYVNLPVGRVDLTNMPSFGADTFLMKRYFEKAMLFRTGARKAQLRTLIEDHFGYMNSEAFASGGFRNGSVFSGRNIKVGDYRSDMSAGSYLLSYGCGPGSYTSCAGVTSSGEFITDSLLNPFTMLFGSYFGDWDNADNLLRAPLASKGWGLANVWSGRPYWMMHPCGLGAPLAQAALTTYNTWNIYNAAGFMSSVHVALMGDPTLRMFAVDNVQDINYHVACQDLELSWPVNNGVADSVIVELNDGGKWKLLGTAAYADAGLKLSLSPGKQNLSIRYLKLMQSASGTWWQYGARTFKEIPIDTITLDVALGDALEYRVCADSVLQFIDQGNFDTSVWSIWTWGTTSKRTYFGDTLNLILTSGSTWIKLSRTSDKGCNYTDSAWVEVETKEILFTREIPSAICTNQMFALVDSVKIVDSAAQNKWTFHSMESMTKPGDTLWIYSSQKGSQKLKLLHTSSLGCPFDFEWTVNFQEPEEPEIEVLKNPGRIGDSIQLQSKDEALAYFWNGSQLAGSRTWDFVADSAEMHFSLTVADDLGCISPLAEKTLYFVINSVFENQSPVRKVYPNPFTDQVFISLESLEGPIELLLLDLQGKVIKEFRLSSGEHSLGLKDLKSGMYFLQSSSSTGKKYTLPLLKF